jgi:hypothetical protein
MKVILKTFFVGLLCELFCAILAELTTLDYTTLLAGCALFVALFNWLENKK